MTAARYVLTAAPERQRFASPGRILGFGLTVAVALYSVFPSHTLEDRLASAVPYNDQVTQAYLNAWLRAKPDDNYVRLMLARHEMQIGHADQAQATLQPLLASNALGGYDRAEAGLMLLDILEQRLWKNPRGTPGYPQARAAYLDQIRAIAGYGWENTRIQRFADQAFALNDAALGRELYLKMIHDNPYTSLNRIDRLAQLDLSDGNYREAASLYFTALPLARSDDERRRFYVEGLSVLRSGNLMPEAINASQVYMGPYAEDSATLTFLVRLALAGHRPDIAAKFASRLVRQRVSFGEGVG